MPYYLGKRNGTLTLFHCPRPPTKESHGHLYAAVIGPFQSRVGAHYFARYGQNNPHLRTAGDAERLARADPRMDEAIATESLSVEDLAVALECAAQDQAEATSFPPRPASPAGDFFQPKESSHAQLV